jgi:hypothetical protein
MIVNKYGAKPEPLGLPIAPRSTATAFGAVRIENESAIQNETNRVSAVQQREFRCNINYGSVCFEDGLHFTST